MHTSHFNQPLNVLTSTHFLSFALSILLGDVFLHLLPEVWLIEANTSDWAFIQFLPSASTTVLLGQFFLIVFISVYSFLYLLLIWTYNTM